MSDSLKPCPHAGRCTLAGEFHGTCGECARVDSLQDRREAFERWARERNCDLTKSISRDGYTDYATDEGWRAWCAALDSQVRLGWCEHCGEGVTDFCRGKTSLCPKGLRVIAATPSPKEHGGG